MDGIADPILTPLRDIVAKGEIVVHNAGHSQPMLGAAQGLVKEGQRALKHIEPLCKKHFQDYGSGFVDALKENDDISRYASQLTDLLWEFDDYVDVGSFRADKYAELQALARKAAPKIYDVLMRLRLESSPRAQPSSPLSLPEWSLQQSLLLPPTALCYPTAVTRPARSPPTSSEARHLNTAQGAATQLQRSMRGRVSNSQDSAPDALRRIPAREPESPPPAEQSPWPSSTNPWDPQVSPVLLDGPSGDYSPVGAISIMYRPESPVDPAISPMTPGRQRNVSYLGRRPAGRVSGRFGYDGGDRRQPPSSVHCHMPAPWYTPRRVGNLSMSIPEEGPVQQSSKPLPELPQDRGSPVPAYYPSFPDMSRRLSDESATSSGDGGGRQQLVVVGERPPGQSPKRYAARLDDLLVPRSPASVPQGQPGLEVPATVIPPTEFDTGLIPLESEELYIKSKAHVPWGDCTISASSSLSYHKGFCEGAKEVMRGNIGVKKMQKPVRRTLSRVVARCTGCPYELDFNQIETDMDKQDEGNFYKCGVGYRLRFLQKSHLPARRTDDILYGCLFCVHQGRTLDESDATVFFTTKALFSHLARHARPLPRVPGLCVVDEAEVPDSLRNGYDIHFPNPPVVHPAHENHAEISGLPTGVAKEQARRMYGQRLLFDRSAALELARGAKVTGIKWPPKYHGEWIFALHDGVFASVPTDIIRLDPPPAADIMMGGASHVRARARWKFAPKDKNKGDWLKFEKSETINNIAWAYPEHWCWSGTNSKGRWGIFPQAFIDTNTVQDLSQDVSNQTNSSSHEKSKSSSVLSKLSMRRSSGRPPSIADSTSSRETAYPVFRLPSRSSKDANDLPGGLMTMAVMRWQ